MLEQIGADLGRHQTRVRPQIFIETFFVRNSVRSTADFSNSALIVNRVVQRHTLRFPSSDGHPRTDSHLGFNGKFAAKPLRTSQPKTESGAGTVTILHRAFQVRYPRTGVLENQAKACFAPSLTISRFALPPPP